MIKTSFLNPQKLPLVIKPAVDEKENAADLDLLVETARSGRDFFREKLLTHGALLFRGYQVRSVSDLERFVDEFSGGEKLFNYAGGVSPRNPLGGGGKGGGVYTSTEYPAQYALSLHNELSYADVYPRHLYFCCLTPAAAGGETTLGDSRRILQNIDAEIAELFKNKKICYVRNLHAVKGDGYSWQEAFETDDKQTVEACCRKIGAQFQWQTSGGLRVRQIRPAIIKHPLTGEEVWFNQADGFHPSNLDAETYQTLIAAMSEDEFRLNVYFGDGSPIDLETLAHIRAVLQSETIPHRWQAGDVLILDNILAAHGRLPFTGARKIALAMT
ncbi:MAG TPA: TauD/TfdA family dioxygenase [Pyrinomonadaceae bacterium]|jgi:alpha-ketoglutarate-dependent taurine dioxygenase